jgi:CheY-like chemotaxis protein
MPFLNDIKTAREIRRLNDPARDECQNAAQWRKAERLAATSIIGLARDPRESRFADARASGMNECIGKPAVRSTLFTLINMPVSGG